MCHDWRASPVSKVPDLESYILLNHTKLASLAHICNPSAEGAGTEHSGAHEPNVLANHGAPGLLRNPVLNNMVKCVCERNTKTDLGQALICTYVHMHMRAPTPTHPPHSTPYIHTYLYLGQNNYGRQVKYKEQWGDYYYFLTKKKKCEGEYLADFFCLST